MKDIVKFFWERMHRAMQMDMASKLQNKPTYYWIEADEWMEAYKKTLSENKKKEFEKEYNKLEEELRLFLKSKKAA